MRAYWINSTAKTVTEVEYTERNIRTFVGGWLEAAFVWPSGDVLYVDEEGLLKDPRHFFRIPERPDQPLAGNGLLVGKEIGDSARTDPPTMSLVDLMSRVRFSV